MTNYLKEKDVDYENISLLQDDIQAIFEDAGFRVLDQSGLKWFERINSRSAYIHPMFKEESVSMDQFIDMFMALRENLSDNDIALDVTVVCHLMGDFMFKVSLA